MRVRPGREVTCRERRKGFKALRDFARHNHATPRLKGRAKITEERLNAVRRLIEHERVAAGRVAGECFTAGLGLRRHKADKGKRFRGEARKRRAL